MRLPKGSLLWFQHSHSPKLFLNKKRGYIWGRSSCINLQESQKGAGLKERMRQTKINSNNNTKHFYLQEHKRQKLDI